MLQDMLKRAKQALSTQNPKQIQKQNFTNIAHTQPVTHQDYHVPPQRRDNWLGVHRDILRRHAA